MTTSAPSLFGPAPSAPDAVAQPSPSSSGEVLSCANVNRQVRTGRFWFYVLALVIVVIITWYLMISRREDGTFAAWNKGWVVPSIDVYMLGSALLLIIAGYVTYAVDQVAPQQYRNWINLAFLLVAIFFVIWVIILFGQLNVRLALVFALLTFIALLWHTYLVWKTVPDLVLPMILVLIGGLVLICSNISLMNNNV